MHPITIIAKWAIQTSETKKLFFSSLINAIVFYTAAILSNSYSEAARLEHQQSLYIHAVFFIGFFAIVSFVYLLFAKKIEHLQEKRKIQESAISRAYKLCDRHIVDQIMLIEGNGPNPIDLLSPYKKSLDRIQVIVDSAYEVFESLYGKSASHEDRIDFEITFMTISFIDSYITIPASANKDKRRPRSMIFREETPDIYCNTVTAEVYRQSSPRMVIVSDTHENSYKELYVEQKTRIKSSIVFPVFSSQNRLLGTLVVHCDRVNFFKKEEQKYWSDLLEIFSKRIAYESIYLVKINDIAESNTHFNIDISGFMPY